MPAHAARPFVLEEATVDSIHAAYRSGSLTAVDLVKAYLARIEAYDQQGPALRAMLTLNPQALQVAARLDAEYKARKGKVGPLHCIPVILKDNFNTFDMPTTGGNVGMKDLAAARPTRSPSSSMRKAGALILAQGQPPGVRARRHVDQQPRRPGAQSLRPHAHPRRLERRHRRRDRRELRRARHRQRHRPVDPLAGVCEQPRRRPTRRAGWSVARGVMPNSLTQDEIGPITRTVTDAALLLDVMAGYDPQRPDHRPCQQGRIPKPTSPHADKDALKGARIGVMKNLLRQGAAPPGSEQGDGRA